MSDTPVNTTPERSTASAMRRRNITPKAKPAPAANTENAFDPLKHPSELGVPPSAPAAAAEMTTTPRGSAQQHALRDHKEESQGAALDANPTVACEREQLYTAAIERLHAANLRTPFPVIDFGVSAEQGSRKTMEDQHIMLSHAVPFFGVYDGHGGTQCAEYLRQNLHVSIFSQLDLLTNPTAAISRSIVEADKAFLSRTGPDTDESGSVCAVALVIEDKLIVGNVGDCEAVLSRNDVPVVLTVKHSLRSNPSEVQRVTAAGGRIFNNRVGHPKFNPSVASLAVTRAIGDAVFKLEDYTDGKPSGIIADPDISTTKLTEEDEFFVIGCDGLWDVMKYDEVVDFCGRRFQKGHSAQSIAKELAQAAIAKGSTDNVTAMVVQLKKFYSGR